MAPTLEAIRGGGGSIKVGTIGTISSLMTRELESSSLKSFPQTPALLDRGNGPLKPRKPKSEASSSGNPNSTNLQQKSPQVVSKSKGQNLSKLTPKQPKQKTPLEEVGNKSNVTREINRKSPDFSGKTRTHKRSYHIPMLGSENIHLEKTPTRNKPMKKVPTIVDIVDINCGNPGGSISNRLKKLNFSKLSQTFM